MKKTFNIVLLTLLAWVSVTYAADNSQKITAAAPLSLASGTLSIPAASGSVNGYLSSTNFTIFNNKAAPGAYITSLTGDVTGTGPGAATATVVTVGGSTASAINTATVLANAATAANTANQIVKRGASGQIAVGAITGGATALTGASSVTGAADAVQLIVKGFSGQTNDVFQVKDATNANLFIVDPVGNGTLTGTITATNLSGTNTGDVTLGAFGSSPDAKGATLTGQALVIQPADATHPGSVSTGAQTFGGAKTFNGTVTAATTVQTTIQDPGAVSAIDVSNRRLKDSTAVNAADWQTRTLNDAGGTAMFAWGGAQTAAVTGNADKVQLQVKGFSTQTNALLSVLKSDNTSLFSVANSGNVAASGNIAATGTLSGSNLSGTNTGDVTLGTANGLSLVGQALSLGLSSGSTTGALSSADWTTFNSKQAAGSYITALTSDVSASGPGSAVATVNSVGGSTASAVNTATIAANAATSANTASTIVKRDGSGSFFAGDITGTSLRAVDALAFVSAAPTTSGTDAIRAINNSGAPGNVSIALQDSTLAKNFRLKADYSTSPEQLGFFYNATNMGQYDANGKWIIGASGGSQAHALNGSLVSTGNITAPAFISSAANTASTGLLRSPNAGLLSWRNAGNTGDLSMQVNASNNFLFDTGLNGVRIGTATFIGNSSELLSVLSNYVTAPLATVNALAVRSVVNTNSIMTTGLLGGSVGTVRAITAGTTDSGAINTFKIDTSLNTGSGNNYANSSGMSALVIAGLSQFGTGTITTNYDAMSFSTDSTAVTGYKNQVYFSGLSGGTLGTAFISDNHLYTGDYAINFATTKPSRFNGVLSNTDTTASTSGTTGSIVTAGGIGADGRIVSSTRVSASGAVSGGNVIVDATNTSNTASSTALIHATTGGASAGNPYFSARITGGNSFSWGLNHADSDSFQIAATTTLTGPAFKITQADAVTIGSSGSTATHSINGNSVQIVGTNAAGHVQESIQNQSTNAAADARLFVGVANSTAGDPYVQLDVPGSGWTVGVDNSDTKSFKIAFSGTPSTGSQFFKIDNNGASTIGSTGGGQTQTLLGPLQVTPNSSSGLAVSGAWNVALGKAVAPSTARVVAIAGNGLAGTSQIGVAVEPTDTTAATSDFYGVLIAPATPNSVFTTARYQGLYVAPLSKGASNTVTRAASIFAATQTDGATGNATITDSLSSVTGNFFIYSIDSNPSQFGGAIRTANGTAALPAHSFSGSTNAGMYFSGGAVRFAFNGAQVFNYSTSAIDFSQSGNVVSIADGTAGIPAVSFPAHPGTGLFRGATEGVGIAANGATSAVFSDTANVLAKQAQATDGSAGAPGYSFNSDTDVGMYRIGTNDLGFATNGIKGLEVDSLGNVAIGRGTTTNSRTSDFNYVSTSAGSPSGVPAVSFTGLVPMVYDTTNNVLAFYNSGWKSPTALGVTDGSNAAAGVVGEYVESLVAAATAWPTTTGLYADGTSISLTAGDWQLTAMLNTVRGGSNVTIQNLGISTTTGNSSAGLVAGQNLAVNTIDTLGAGTDALTMTVPVYRQNTTSTTTYYLKVNATFAGAAPTYSARLSARRVR